MGLITLALFAGVARATVYYVDNSCTTGGTGRSPVCNQSDGPFLSIAAAMSASLAPGDTIKLRATGQPYAENTVTTPVAGTASAPIVLTRYDADTALPRWTGSSGERLVLDRAYWIVEWVELDGNGLNNDLVSVNAPNVTIRNSVLHNNLNDGISIGAAGDNLTVRDCELYDLGTGGDRHAITTGRESGDGSNYVITGLRIVNNLFRDEGGDCIQFSEGSDLCRVATVTGLIDGNIMRKGSRPGHENAIDIKATALANDPLVISANIITGWDGSSTSEGNRAVVIAHCAEYIKFRYNFVDAYGPGNEGLSCSPCMGINIQADAGFAAPPADTSIKGIEVVGNVFRRMRDAVEIGANNTVLKLGDAKFYNNTVDALLREAFRIQTTNSIYTNCLLRNNLTYRSPTGGTSSPAGWTYSHNGWFNTPCGQRCGSNDVTGTDPLFVNPAAGDYNLQPGSLCIDRGADVGLPYAGLAPDLGALEFQGTVADTIPPAAIRDLIAGP